MKFLKLLLWLFASAILTAGISDRANADTMNDKKASIAAICAASATGNMKALRINYHRALESNAISRGELADIMYIVGNFAGYPRSETAFDLINSINEELRVRGMTADEISGEITPVAMDAKCQSDFLRSIKSTELAKLSPSLEVEAFGAISGALCARGEMSFEYRAIATIATLAVTDANGVFLKYQMRRELTFGVTPKDLRDLISGIKDLLGEERTMSVNAMIDECVAAQNEEKKESVFIVEMNDGK